jgi:hypothetical protein
MDRRALGTLLKAFKRTMAGEFVPELSTKVFTGQSLITRMGFWRGGYPSYGLRRLSVDEARRIKVQLEFGSARACRPIEPS